MPKAIALTCVAAAIAQLVFVSQIYGEFLLMLRKGGSSIGPVGALNVVAFYGLSGAFVIAACWGYVRYPNEKWLFRGAMSIAACGLISGCVLFFGQLASGALNV